MKSVRLPRQLEQKLKTYASREGKSESEVIREALVEYMNKEKELVTPYEAGKDLFGQVGSGTAGRSASYKSEIRKKVRERKTSR